MKVAFIGLGVMGFPMAGHLAAAGHEVAVFNRSPEKARRWAAEHGGRFGATVAEAVEACEFVMLCVGNEVHGARQHAFGPLLLAGGLVRHLVGTGNPSHADDVGADGETLRDRDDGDLGAERLRERKPVIDTLLRDIGTVGGNQYVLVHGGACPIILI